MEESCEIAISENGQVITRGELDLRLPTRDFRLMSALLQEPGRAYSNQAASMAVWDESDRDLNNLIGLVRSRINVLGHNFIQSANDERGTNGFGFVQIATAELEVLG